MQQNCKARGRSREATNETWDCTEGEGECHCEFRREGDGTCEVVINDVVNDPSSRSTEVFERELIRVRAHMKADVKKELTKKHVEAVQNCQREKRKKARTQLDEERTKLRRSERRSEEAIP